MDSNVDITPIVSPLIAFLLSPDQQKQIPHTLTLILQNTQYIQHPIISIFFAKVIRHIQNNDITIPTLSDHTRSPLPPSIYHGIIHPSSVIQTFCRTTLSQTHRKNSLSSFDDYTNIIRPIIAVIQENLAFMRYTVDHSQFDTRERSIKIDTKTLESVEAIPSNAIQYIECDLYHGLKELMDILSEDIINNNIFVNGAGLFNILLSKCDVSKSEDISDKNEQKMLGFCMGILKNIFKCPNHCLFWENRNLLTPNMNQFIHKLMSIFMAVFDLGLKKGGLHKEIVQCIEVVLQCKDYSKTNSNDVKLLYNALNALIIECWNKKKVSSKAGEAILNSAFSAMIGIVNGSDLIKRQILFSLMSKWSKICINFAVAGNVGDEGDESDDGAGNIRKRLKLYRILSAKFIQALQSSKITNFVSQILRLDAQNMKNIMQTYLFGIAYQKHYALDIMSFTDFETQKNHKNNKKNKNKDLLYQNNSLWNELLNKKIDAWNYPASMHRLMFEIYNDFAIWDHESIYQNQVETVNKQFVYVYKAFITRISKYCDIIIDASENLGQSILCAVGPGSILVLKYIVSSYILSGNARLKHKIRDIIHGAFNRDENERKEYVIIEQSLVGKEFEYLLRYVMNNKEEFMYCLDTNEMYHRFVQLIADGVLLGIERFQRQLEHISNVPALFSNDRMKIRYFLLTKQHILSIIANVFRFIQYFKDHSIKWQNLSDKNKKAKFETRNFSEIIFSESNSLVGLLEYVLLSKSGIFAAEISDFLSNKYFDKNVQRIEDIVSILKFLSNHWTTRIERIIDNIPNTAAFDGKRLFTWFPILKYVSIGKEWIDLLVAITDNNAGIKLKFNLFMKDTRNYDAIKTILNELFDTNKIKAHQKKCKTTKCSSYHLNHRQKLMDLLGDLNCDNKFTFDSLNNDLSVFTFGGIESGKSNGNKGSKPSKKKFKKAKQWKITEYMTKESSLTSATSLTTHSTSSATHNKHTKDHKNNTEIEIEMHEEEMNSLTPELTGVNSLTPEPISFMHPKKKKKDTKMDIDMDVGIAPFQILDRQFSADTSMLMYSIDFTDASRTGPDWKSKEEIKTEFGAVGEESVNEWNEKNKNTEIETMWSVKAIKDKRTTNGEIEYKVLWEHHSECTWETIDNLDGCNLSIQEYENAQKGNKRKSEDQKQNSAEPKRKRIKLRNGSKDVSSEEESDDSDVSSSDMTDFIEGQVSDDGVYNPNSDRKVTKKARKLKRYKRKKAIKSKHAYLGRKRINDSVGLSANDESDGSTDDDFPISSNHMRHKQRKKEKQNEIDIWNKITNRKRERESNNDFNSKNKRQRLNNNKYNSKNTHPNMALKAQSKANKFGKLSSKSASGLVAPSGDIIPTSNVPITFKRNVSRATGGSKLTKLQRSHHNSVLAGNIAAKQNYANTFRRNDLSKTGNFRKRVGGAVILQPNQARKNRMNPGLIPKTTKIPKSSELEEKYQNKSNKLKSKLPVKRNRYEYKPSQIQTKPSQIQTKPSYYNNNTNTNSNNIPIRHRQRNRTQNHNQSMNYRRTNRITNNIHQIRHDCEYNLFKKILKWTPDYVESALNETQSDLTPLATSHPNTNEYKELIEPFLLEEVRAQIAQNIEDKKRSKLQKRPQDSSSNQRNKKKQHSQRRSNVTFYDIARITNYIVQPDSTSTVIVQPTSAYTRLHKLYYKNDLVLLVQDTKLTMQSHTSPMRIEHILGTAVLGTIKSNSDNDPFAIYINSEHTSFRSKGNLCAIIHLTSLVTACREYQCLATMAENEWSQKIIQPKGIRAVDGMTQLDIRDKQLPKWMKKRLNEPQLNAISACLTRENNIVLIKGPPGTGKTTTIVSLINAALLRHGYMKEIQRPKILCCAPSNAAVDEIISRTYDNMRTQSGDRKLSVKMVRIGSGTRPNTIAANIHIEKLIDPKNKMRQLQEELKKLESDKNQQKMKWIKVKKRVASHDCTEEDKISEQKLAEKIRNLQIKKNKIDERIQNEKQFNSNNNNYRKPDRVAFLRTQDIIFTTLSAAASTYLNKLQFDLLVIDESTQACEVSSLIPFQLDVRSIVLVGDEKQLPATVVSNSAKLFGYSTSFFERCLKEGVDPYLLNIQYRMHPAIAKWPNEEFYDGQLKHGPNIKNEIIPLVEKHESDPRLKPYIFYDVYHDKEQKTETGKSYVNKAELDFILRLLDYMSYKFYTKNREKRWNGNVGIVTPYRGQVKQFRKYLNAHENKLLHSVVVDTVESFQGSEKDIIIFSCVRSQRLSPQNQENAKLGFLIDTKRLNVALTRAKYCCIIVGNSSTLRSDKTWKALIQDAHKRGCIYKVDTTDHKKWLNRESKCFKTSLQKQKEGNSNNNRNGKEYDTDIKMSSNNNGNNRNNGSNTNIVPMDIDEDSSNNSKSNSVKSQVSVKSTGSSKSRHSSKSKNSRSRSSSREHHSYHSKSNSRSKSRYKSRDDRTRRDDRSYKENRKRHHRKDKKRSERKLTDAEIARKLNLPSPPTDPRRRR